MFRFIEKTMKKLTYLISVALIFASCSSKMVAVQSSSALDYTKFEKDGLFLTESNSVSFNYQAIASISALNLSGFKKAADARKQAAKDYFSDIETDVKLSANWFNATREGVLIDLCKKAKEQGANGIINIKITYISIPFDKDTNQTGYEASGMAIKK